MAHNHTSNSTPVLTSTENRTPGQQVFVDLEKNLREQKQNLDALLINASDPSADSDKILSAAVEGLIALFSASSLLPDFKTGLIPNPNLEPNANGSPTPVAVTTAPTTKKSKLLTLPNLLGELSSCNLQLEGAAAVKPEEQQSGESPLQNEGVKGEENGVEKCGESEIDGRVSNDCEQYNGHTDCSPHRHRHNDFNIGSKNKGENSVSKEPLLSEYVAHNQTPCFKASLLREINQAMLEMWNDPEHEAHYDYSNASDEEDELRKLIERDARFCEEFDEYFESVSALHQTESVPPPLIPSETGVLKKSRRSRRSRKSASRANFRTPA